MRDITYKTLDYIYDNDWVRRVWLAVAWLGLLICTYEPEGWRFGAVVVCGLLIHWHGLIDGAKAAIESEEMTKDELLKLVTVLQAELEATNRQVEILSDVLAESRREVAAIKQARSAPVQEPVANNWSVFNTGAEVWDKLSLADAVVELTPSRLERGWSAVCVIDKDNPPLYTTPPAAPVQGPKETDFPRALRLYDEAVERLSPAAQRPVPEEREWVGLTDDEIDKTPCELYAPDQGGMTMEEGLQVYAQAIEAKLRSKNNG